MRYGVSITSLELQLEFELPSQLELFIIFTHLYLQ